MYTHIGVIHIYIWVPVMPDWKYVENHGVEVKMYTRGSGMGEQQVPDLYLITSMYQDLVRRPPGKAILVMGDVAGFDKGEGLGATLRVMYTAGWKVELISWVHCINRFLIKTVG